MPKMKTKKSASKRFRFTATGKVKRSQAYKSHILTKKTTKRKRSLRSPALAHQTDVAHVRAMLPYGTK
jgi:large subunit ribosomal protein L35